MEVDFLNRINKLKQDLTAVGHSSRKSEDLGAYLSQSYRKPEIEEHVIITPFNYKGILEEKQIRISELEEEVSYLRESIKNKEQDLITKYDKAIESIKSYYVGLINDYENSLKNNKPLSETQSPNEVLENLRKLEEENKRLKNEIKSQHTSFIKEKHILQQELYELKDNASYSKSREIDEKFDIEELIGIKEKLEKEVANLQKDKNQLFSNAFEEFKQGNEKNAKVAEMWKTRADQMGLQFFTFLRSLKIDLYEIKRDIMNSFEDATTNASSIVTKLLRRYKIVMVD